MSLLEAAMRQREMEHEEEQLAPKKRPRRVRVLCKKPGCDRGGKHEGFCCHHTPEGEAYFREWRKAYMRRRRA